VTSHVDINTSHGADTSYVTCPSRCPSQPTNYCFHSDTPVRDDLVAVAWFETGSLGKTLKLARRGGPENKEHFSCEYLPLAQQGCIIFSSVRLSVCLSRKNFKLILLFLFLDGIEPFFGRQSMWHATKPCSSILNLGPLTPEICSPKFAIAQNRL